MRWISTRFPCFAQSLELSVLQCSSFNLKCHIFPVVSKHFPNSSLAMSLINFLSFQNTKSYALPYMLVVSFLFSSWWWLNTISFERLAQLMCGWKEVTVPSFHLKAIIHARGINHFSLVFGVLRGQYLLFYFIYRGIMRPFKCKFDSCT